MFHGRGAYTFASGDRYEGEYSNGLCHGQGAYSWKNGSMYEGEYRHGSKSGVGTESTARGRFTGEWCDNKIHGRGVWQWKTGTIYQGFFEMNCPTQAVLCERDGQCFTVQYAKQCDEIHCNSKPSSKIKASSSCAAVSPTSLHRLKSPTPPTQSSQARAQSPTGARPHTPTHAAGRESDADEAVLAHAPAPVRETTGIPSPEEGHGGLSS